MISKNERKCTYLQKFLKKKKQGEKYILDNFFSLKNDEQMSKRQKPAKIFLCPPNTTYPTNIIQGKEKKNLKVLKKHHPVVNWMLVVRKWNKQKQKEKAIFFAVLNNFVFFLCSLP